MGLRGGWRRTLRQEHVYARDGYSIFSLLLSCPGGGCRGPTFAAHGDFNGPWRAERFDRSMCVRATVILFSRCRILVRFLPLHVLRRQFIGRSDLRGRFHGMLASGLWASPGQVCHVNAPGASPVCFYVDYVWHPGSGIGHRSMGAGVCRGPTSAAHGGFNGASTRVARRALPREHACVYVCARRGGGDVCTRCWACPQSSGTPELLGLFYFCGLFCALFHVTKEGS